MPRTILHLDLDAFFCAVEENKQPALRHKPFAVGGKPESRGVVASCSYAARVFGVRSAMSMKQALQRCPQLVIVPPSRADYSRLSRQVMERLHTLTPLVEQLSIDEAFLDISDLPGPPESVARELQKTINTDLDLPCSLGVAANKLVAKIANDVGKSKNRGDSPPNAITVVPPGKEMDFLAGLPVIVLWGVGPKTSQRLAGLGIHTVGDLAKWPENELARQFGKHGLYLFRAARGQDDTPIITSHDPKSISQEVTFARDISDEAQLRRNLFNMAEEVGKRLRAHQLRGRTIKLKLRWPDFTTLTRQVTLSLPTDQDREIYTAVEQLFQQNWKPNAPVRLVGVGVSGFDPQPVQLSLWQASSERNQRLQQAIDELRQKYGAGVVQQGPAGKPSQPKDH